MPIDFNACKDNDSIQTFSPKDPITEVEQKDVAFDLMGCDSRVYRDCKREASNQVIAKAAKNAKKLTTAEAIEAQTLDRVCRCIKGWRGVTDDNGQELPFSYDTALDFIGKRSWLLEQLEEFIGERQNFFAK